MSNNQCLLEMEVVDLHRKSMKIISSMLVMSLALSSAQVALAVEQGELKAKLGSTQVVYISTKELKKAPLITTDSKDYVTSQLETLYKDVADQFGVPYTYVKAMHIIAGGKAIFSDRMPQIYSEEALRTSKAPFEIDRVVQVYDKKATFAECPDESIERPSKYYMPDAAYNVMSTINNIMESRYTVDRGSLQTYFDALLPDAKQNVVFYEALMQYLGYSDSEVNSLYSAYERVVYKKEKAEYVIELEQSGEYKVKDKFKEIFTRYGIPNIDSIAVAMSFDGLMAQYDSPDKLKSEIPLHYKVGYTSRENMMVAALSLVGKVRYVWGGGHVGTGNIDGINPMWECFNELYNSSGNSARCMKPSSTWCPVHGDIGSTANTCMISDTSVSKIDEYLELRGEMLSTTKAYGKIEGKNLYKIFNNGNVGYTRNNGTGSAVSSHRLEGLDCSGFASWLYNQIDNERIYDSGSTRFVQSGNLTELDMGTPLLPGDVLAWNEHIVVIVGKIDETSQVYLEIESTPNVLKLGIAYYPGATQAQISYAKELARQANTLLGNVQDTRVNSFSIKGLEYSTQAYTDAEGNLQMSYNKVLSIGRLGRSFIDESEIVDGYDKTMSQITAKEILQHTINILPADYISGAEVYTGGELFYVG